MNNLHRELAPISDAAWAQIEEEATRTLKRYLAARRVVDVDGPQGSMLSAVGTGHLSGIEAPAEGILARQRDRQAAGGAACAVRTGSPGRSTTWSAARQDSDWQAGEGCREAALPLPRIARCSTATPPAGSKGMRQAHQQSGRDRCRAILRDYPDVIAQALSQLRLVGVNGPYSRGAERRRVHRPERDQRPWVSRCWSTSSGW